MHTTSEVIQFGMAAFFYISLFSYSQSIAMVQRYNNKIKITTTIYNIYIQAKERCYKELRTRRTKQY